MCEPTNKIINTLSDTFEVVHKNVQYNIADFVDFLYGNNIVQLGTAFIISTQINQLTTSFVDNMISPIIKAFVGSNEKSLKDTRLSILGIDFEVGTFLAALLKFLIMMVVLYYIFIIIGKRRQK